MNTTANRLKTFLKTYGKVAALLLTMLIGVLIPQAHVLSDLVQYLFMAMLFFAFLDIEINPKNFQKGVLWLLLANIAIAFIAYKILSFFNVDLAMAAFITAIAPTAISSTVIVGFINGRVDFMVTAVLLSNIVMSIVVSIALPFLSDTGTNMSIWEVLRPVMITMFIPLILARLASHLPSKAQPVIRAGKKFSFPLWLANLFIVSAKASDFIRNEAPNSMDLIIQIALISLVICVINFAIGAALGGHDYWQEYSQALGQKNNSFVIWIALTFVNPLAAIGPTFYILYHNLYNTWQIYNFEKRRNL